MSRTHDRIELMNSRLVRAALGVLVAIFALPVVTYAQHTSPNYEVDEVFIGSGGELDACSNGYCTHQSAGGIGGDASSGSYGILAGFNTPDEPTLSLTVSNNNIDLGVLNTSSTAAASANFSVSNYLSDGYVVQVRGRTPTNVTGPGTHSLISLNSPSSSQPGTEQFGINLRANTIPGIGANPAQQPDSTFSYGEPTVGYNQVNYFKYVDGDIIAMSERESGQTDYTMSIIANVSTATPGGRYQAVLVIQAIATF